MLCPGGYKVRGLVPQGFGGYARIFFPFVTDVVVDGQTREEHVTWKEMARRNGRVAHALMEEQNILVGRDED